MMRKFLIILVVFLTAFSCGNEKKFVPLNIVIDKPLEKGKYPENFKNIVLPFSSKECSTDYFFKPINLIRLDISNKLKETNAWYFEARGDEITIERITYWLDFYFTDSLVPKYATLPAKRKVDEDFLKRYIDKLKAKYNVFILTEDSELDEFDGVPVLHNPKDVNKKIQEVACKLKGDKIFVLVNPKVLNEMQEEQPIEEPTQEDQNQSGEEATKTTDATTTQKSQTTTTTTGVHKKPVKTTITVGNTHFTKRGGNYYSAYARYEGGVENGKAHGQGTMIFTRSHLIPVPPYSAKKITARKGYKLAGRFNNGYFVSGKLYDASGRKIKSIYIGR